MVDKKIEITLDIETIPNQNLSKHDVLTIGRKLKMDESNILANYDFFINSDEFKKYASVNQEFNQIVCICMDINSNHEIDYSGFDESNILKNFYDFFTEFKQNEIKFITFNGKKFDFPIIKYRSAINRINPTIQLDTKRYYTDKHFDCFEILSNFYQNQNALKLQEYATLFELDNNDNSDGSEVLTLCNDNKFSDVINHCFEDIKTTKRLYNRIKYYY